MNEHVTYRECLPLLYSQQEGEISAKIQGFSGRPSEREKWIVEHLTKLLFQDGEPLFASLEQAALFYLFYEARSYRSEDIKSVYRAKIGRKYNVSLNEMSQLQLSVPLPSVQLFPPGSLAIQFEFILRKPYISRDDNDFYILDNPIKKEWVFKVPYVAPSQWKGALRAAMISDLAVEFRANVIGEDEFVAKRLQLCRLFGNEKDGTADFLNRIWAWQHVGPSPEDKSLQEEWNKRFRDEDMLVAQEFEQKLLENGYIQGDIEGFRGSLYFYPTYFDQIGLEVINPHDRKTGAGKLPIYFECVPIGAKGIFTLLCVPLGGLELSPEEIEKQAFSDLQAVAEGIKAMMTRYGFGAKTSSGFGVAEVDPAMATIKPEEFRRYWQTAWEVSP
jgi:CRISPR-associated protein Cmr2